MVFDDPPIGRAITNSTSTIRTFARKGEKTMKFRMMSVFLAMVMALGGLQNALADYVAYSVGEKDKSPLPERLDKIDTKYLLNIEWGDYSGRKTRLGVLKVDNNSSSSSFTVTSSLGDVNYSDSTTGVPVNGIESIVIDSLAQTGRFRLVERAELASVLGEQDLVTSGRIAKSSGAETGNVLGAEFLVQLVITDYETKTSGTDKGVGGLLFSKIPLFGGINQAVFELIKQVGAKPPEGSIVKADASQIYTNLGQDSVAVGDRLQVLRKGEELIDPETGISLGGSSTAIGEIEVTQVQEKFSIASPVSMNGSPERGDKVVGTKIAAPLEFASKWKKPK